MTSVIPLAQELYFKIIGGQYLFVQHDSSSNGLNLPCKVRCLAS